MCTWKSQLAKIISSIYITKRAPFTRIIIIIIIIAIYKNYGRLVCDQIL